MNTMHRQLISILLAMAFLLVAGCSTHAPQSAQDHLTAKSKDGSLIDYGVQGSGKPTLVFIHGWACDHTVWDNQIDAFADRYQIVWLDLAGNGESGSKRSTYTIQAYGQDVAAVVEQVGADDVILVGHSMGGPVAVEAANILGDKVRGIVVVDNFHTPLFDVPEKAKLGMLNTLKSDYSEKFDGMVAPMFTSSASPETVREVTRKMSEADEDVSVSSLHECILWNSREAGRYLAVYEGKIYNINADPSGIATTERQDVVLIPNVGHFIQIVKPEEFNQALNAYLHRME